MTTVYFDFETGGVLESHPSIQIAAIAVDDETGKEISSFERKLKFDPALCDPKALEINHYTAEAWKDAQSPLYVAGEFAAWVKPHCCVPMVSKRGSTFYVAKGAGYNALTFDWPRLKAMFGSGFLPVSYHIRDVLQRAMWWFDEHPELPRPIDLKLGTVCEYFGIAIDGAHDALVDVRLTAALVQRLRRDILPA
jgi:DNA polymerase III epsilon subunit-like protein